jgi:hypothetical protein
MSVELVSVEPVLTGTRPALRVVVTDGTGPATIISALTLYPQDPLWATYWFDPATGYYGMGRYVRPDVVDIPREQVAEIRGMEITVEAEAPTVDLLKRDGKRTLRVGQFVECQPKQKKGTGKAAGTIKTIWADGTVEVAIGTTTVKVDAGWVNAKNRK